VKVTRIVDEITQFTNKSLQFTDGNLHFFNEVLKTNESAQVSFDLAKTDRIQLFSGMLFEEFNIRDYKDFALFVREDETKS
jgi:hypothetical protein